jgi:hypothetical protein
MQRCRIKHATYLLSDHRQHLDVNTVELVEARPRASLGQTREEAAHHLVVQTVRAVEHDALHRQRLCQILYRLGLEHEALRGQSITWMKRTLHTHRKMTAAANSTCTACMGVVSDLARASGTCRSTAKAQMKRSCERHVALVGERRDDQAVAVAKVLIAVNESRVCLADDDVLCKQRSRSIG